MSVDLFVTLKRSLALYEIEELTSAALGAILSLERVPNVEAQFDLSDRNGKDGISCLGIGSRCVLCSISGYEERAWVIPMRLPGLPTAEDPYGNDTSLYQDSLVITVAYVKSALNYALCAAIAAGIALSQDAEIQDNSGFYTLNNDPTPREFLQTLKLPQPQTELQGAAELLYARMPKSEQVGDRGNK
jgi:hypothetical protein